MGNLENLRLKNLYRYYTTPKGNKISIIDVKIKPCGNTEYIFECDVCSKDVEMFPKGTLKGSITKFNTQNIKCGCQDNYRLNKSQASVKHNRYLSELKINTDENGIILYYKSVYPSTSEKVSYFKNLCVMQADKLGQEFLGFIIEDNFNWYTRVKVKCHNSGIVWDTSKVYLYLKHDACKCTECLHKSISAKAKVTKSNKKVLKYGAAYNDLAHDSNYISKHCPYYLRWHDILKRSLCSNFKRKRPSYKDVTICDEWLTFSNFKSWMEKQDWEGKDIDKDLLVKDNKVYSPETCIFVHGYINRFILDRKNDRGAYLLGVTFRRGRYTASISNPFTGKHEHIGDYITEEEAHFAWKKKKHLYGCMIAMSEDVTDERLKNVLLTRWSDYNSIDPSHIGNVSVLSDDK